MVHRLWILTFCVMFPLTASAQLSQVGKGFELDKLPEVAEDFKVKLWAKEPTLLHPASLTFDRKGRMYVGHGPQFRKPSLKTDSDSILMLEDKDGDGIAETTKVFATGFSCIQALAWKGNDLWVANCPSATFSKTARRPTAAPETVNAWRPALKLKCSPVTCSRSVDSVSTSRPPTKCTTNFGKYRATQTDPDDRRRRMSDAVFDAPP